MSAVFIIFCLVVFLGVVGICAYYKNEMEEQKRTITVLENRNNTQNAFEFLQSVARKNQIKVEELDRDEDWVTCVFDYQGGHYICYCGADNDELLIHFNRVEFVPYSQENLEQVQSLCQRLTRLYRYAKFVYDYNAQENQISIDIRFECINLREDTFMNYLNLCFDGARAVADAIKNPTISDDDIMGLQRDRVMLADAERIYEEDAFRASHPHSKAPNHGTLGEYISYLFDEEKVQDMLSLTIQNEEGVSKIVQKDKITGFDLLSAIIDDSGEVAQMRSSSPAVLTVDAVSNHYVFTLHPLESNDLMLSVRMTAVRTPHEYLQNYVPEATYVPEAVSMRLCYAKVDLPFSQSEEEQKLLVPNIVKQMQHGHELMQQKCFLQAIAVMTPVFRKLKSQFYRLNNDKKEMFFTLCFDLGFCYTELRQYEKAFYYLDMANLCNRFDYSEEYFNCLTNGQDIRVFRELSKEVDSISKLIEDIDMDDDRGTEKKMDQRTRLVDYYAFLERHRGYAQISFGYLEDAEKTFKKLLDHEGSREYAENELKYIEMLRNKEKH